ncbi:sensor histidine kinase [Paenibacillus terreus]|uniref:Sensor histidine kinase n=1 Tax=Paenibacillus terreus TaxID=1387834 RepID=A0ABV5BE67_9BACL
MKQSILKLVMDRTFFTKIFISISSVSFIGVFALAIVYQHNFQEVLTNNEMNRVKRSIDQAALNLDNQLYRIVSNVHYFFEYSGNGNQFMQLPADLSTVAGEQADAWAKSTLMAFRMQYSSEIDSVFFLLRDQDSGQENLFFDSELDPVPDTDYQSQSWYRSFRAGTSNFWSQPTEELLFYQDRSFRTIYLTLPRYNVNGRDGVLVVRLNGNVFRDAFRLLITPDLNLSLRNSTGQVVYSSLAGSSKSQAQFITMDADLRNSGFTVQAYIKRDSILEAVKQTQNFQPFIIILILLITLFFSMILSLSLVRPIKSLLHLMKKAEKGDLSVRFASKFTDEIGVLGNGFDLMLQNLNASIHKVHQAELDKLNAEMKQKDAVMAAMQSQINPHFLYNTLEVINCQAILYDVPSVSKMSKALADFFRYSVDQPLAEVKLSVELAHIQTYLELQNERYPDVEIDVEGLKEFAEYPILKLTLQPIAENAFKYAFTGKRDYYLALYGKHLDDTDYVICIEDNGEGMDEDLLQCLNEALKGSVRWDSTAAHGWSGGIGLLNVHSRIRHKYGEGYGLRIQESVSGGVAVEIRLPKMGGSDVYTHS